MEFTLNEEILRSRIADVAKLTAIDSGTTLDMVRGTINGMCYMYETLVPFGGKFLREAFFSSLPKNFVVRRIPIGFLSERQSEWVLAWHALPAPIDLVDDMEKQGLQLSKEGRGSFNISLLHVFSLLNSYYSELQAGWRKAFIGKPHESGSDSMLIDFAVYDLRKENDPSRINWHCQNVSQVAFNGGLLVRRDQSSIHT